MRSPEPDPAVPGAEPYHRLHRLGRPGWWWGPLGAVLLVPLLVVASVVTGEVVEDVAGRLGAPFDVEPLTPAGLVWVNLVWAVAIPIVWALVVLLHRLPGGVLLSVLGRLRWRWLLTCAGLAVVALVAASAVGLVVPDHGGADLDGPVNDLTRRTLDFALVIALLTPLQAAGEELAFRGYLTQAFGGLLASRAGAGVAVVVPALLFTVAHGPQEWPAFVDRLAFGLVAGALTILTGGLEAGIAMHVLNNWAALGLALLLGDIRTVLVPTGLTWWMLPGTLVQGLTYLALAAWWARRSGLETVASRAVLERRAGRV